jgi:hypothetical protein
MRIPKRDLIATGLVVAAGLLYLLWATGVAPPGLSATRATGVAVLVLGFAASASAVVPGFDQLLHGNKVYLVTTSVIGLVALAGGVQMLLVGSEVGLAVVVGAMAVLWLIATIHHVHLAEAATAPTRPTAAPFQHRARAA